MAYVVKKIPARKDASLWYMPLKETWVPQQHCFPVLLCRKKCSVWQNYWMTEGDEWGRAGIVILMNLHKLFQLRMGMNWKNRGLCRFMVCKVSLDLPRFVNHFEFVRFMQLPWGEWPVETVETFTCKLRKHLKAF